jgi:hypothetical protein
MRASLMSAKILVVMFALVAQGAGLRAGQAGTYILYGALPSCGTWTAEGHPNALEAWVWGFVSGAGFAYSQSNTELAHTDSEGIVGWMTKYCSDHPLDSLPTAAVALVSELHSRAK